MVERQFKTKISMKWDVEGIIRGNEMPAAWIDRDLLNRQQRERERKLNESKLIPIIRKKFGSSWETFVTHAVSHRSECRPSKGKGDDSVHNKMMVEQKLLRECIDQLMGHSMASRSRDFMDYARYLTRTPPNQPVELCQLLKIQQSDLYDERLIYCYIACEYLYRKPVDIIRMCMQGSLHVDWDSVNLFAFSSYWYHSLRYRQDEGYPGYYYDSDLSSFTDESVASKAIMDLISQDRLVEKRIAELFAGQVIGYLPYGGRRGCIVDELILRGGMQVALRFGVVDRAMLEAHYARVAETRGMIVDTILRSTRLPKDLAKLVDDYFEGAAAPFHPRFL